MLGDKAWLTVVVKKFNEVKVQPVKFFHSKLFVYGFLGATKLEAYSCLLSAALRSPLH